ncbi:MAG TPA: cell wall hydrolase [Aestuariivirga sp.]|nr:cell wall hydrolase [Aestuariivirga sp.]
MDRSVHTLMFVVCALALSATPMGAALKPNDFPPSLEVFIKFRQGQTPDTPELPASVNQVAPLVAWRNRIAELLSLQMVEKSCLATAVYFEARSESALGQLAVANVIINRAKTPAYPSTICGVVFQGSKRFNACQFSFACDGKPDVPQAGRAWQKATAIADLLLPVEKKKKYEEFMFVSTATHYHTVEIKPRWSNSLSRLNQIGRHIFYSQEASVLAPNDNAVAPSSGETADFGTTKNTTL